MSCGFKNVKNGRRSNQDCRKYVYILDKLLYIDYFGTGILRMYEAYNGTNKLPEFKVRPNSFKVLLPNVNWRKNQVDKSDKKDNINEETVLFMLEKNGK